MYNMSARNCNATTSTPDVGFGSYHQTYACINRLIESTSYVHASLMNHIDDEYDKYHDSVRTQLILTVTLLLLVMLVCTISGLWYVRSLRSMMNKTSNMVEFIGDKSKRIQGEKRRSEAVLKEMLPLSTVHQLLAGKEVTPQFYGSVTIHFSTVVGFEDMTSSYSALIIVEFLNGLYRYINIQERIPVRIHSGTYRDKHVLL